MDSFKDDDTKKILILCANNKSYESQRWKNICKDFIDTENYIPYFLGMDITQDLPYKINSEFSQSKFEDNFFDCILSEHCPQFMFNIDNINKISNILKFEGLFITPNYPNFYNDKFIQSEKTSSCYIILKKIN